MSRLLTILLSCILFFGLQLSAQGENDYKYLSIGLNPTMMLEPFTPSLGIGLEFSILKNLHGELTYGLDPNIKSTSHPAPESRHHEYKMALKYLFVDHYTNFPTPYIGLEYFAIRNKYELTDDTFPSSNFWFDFYAGIGVRHINIIYFPNIRRPGSIRFIDELFGSNNNRKVGTRRAIALAVGFKASYKLY